MRSATPQAFAASCAGSSMRAMRPCGSNAMSRADGEGAGRDDFAVGHEASLVVPPPMSTFRTTLEASRDIATAPEPCAARTHSRSWPAEAHTNLPASAAEELGDCACIAALHRLSGEDHRARVDLATVEPGIFVTARDEGFQGARVDRSVGKERREKDRDFHRMRRSTTTNALERACVFALQRTVANMRCEVELPMSMPTVASSTFSTFQMYSVSSPRRPTEISWTWSPSPS